MGEEKKMLSFPEGFEWGTATAAFQIEGGHEERGLSIWDAFCEKEGNVENGDHGKVACDHYNKYKEDVRLLKDLGVHSYRFSISWPRLFPEGYFGKRLIRKRESEGKEVVVEGDERDFGLNEKGRQFYSDLIDYLLENNVQPTITLYHWDLPLPLEEEGGWLSPNISDIFTEYAERVFAYFGDRVKKWITINEPWCVAVMGYCTGDHAPGHDSKPGEEVYEVAHNLLLAHAKTVDVYRRFYMPEDGAIGLSINTNWWEPYSDHEDDHKKSHFSLALNLSWFADPIYFGDYPAEMKETLGDRLPKFTPEQQKLLKGSSDFFGLNTYTMTYAGVGTAYRHTKNILNIIRMNPEGLKGTKMAKSMLKNKYHYFKDMDCLIMIDDEDGLTDMGWPIAPWGIRKLLEHIQKLYSPPGGIYVFENGMAVKETNKFEAQSDTRRLDYLYSYLSEVHHAIQNGVDLRGYYYWSLLDNFEWACGYKKRFGLFYVDYETQERTPKASSYLYREVVKQNGLSIWEEDKRENMERRRLLKGFGKTYVKKLRERGVLEGREGRERDLHHEEDDHDDHHRHHRVAMISSKSLMAILVVFFSIFLFFLSILV
mmetsp:Transcript_24727/g.34019  ORF Transcript_24727/g.34019 Transcript_24727/m.34019 type:complete len:597 (+) Transcript_24727:44-1834(+)|eukprot:CAMPEP_0201475316 /NCGR_PEP_ID=MMETSP0151_2-20130828/757_1 /ASSEMBLY_ACC=CAM_ASM_000257 /TAXON_ID=200890 /ORGANISM="Paramoeba atlantica, Strain 621/1 / CCAP 1560/9" /LENGTH=596 /DNA_ID=CAMNT_0047855371 /DNA_START=24 /DNA_END=1814 /DNA_ORIENTATION=-